MDVPDYAAEEAVLVQEAEARAAALAEYRANRAAVSAATVPAAREAAIRQVQSSSKLNSTLTTVAVIAATVTGVAVVIALLRRYHSQSRFDNALLKRATPNTTATITRSTRTNVEQPAIKPKPTDTTTNDMHYASAYSMDASKALLERGPRNKMPNNKRQVTFAPGTAFGDDDSGAITVEHQDERMERMANQLMGWSDENGTNDWVNTIVLNDAPDGQRVYRYADVAIKSTDHPSTYPAMMPTAVPPHLSGTSMGNALQAGLRDDADVSAIAATSKQKYDEQEAMDKRTREEWRAASAKYCDTDDMIFVPFPRNTASADPARPVRGQCYKQCEIDEDFMPWVSPAGRANVSNSFAWVCRKRCKPKADGTLVQSKNGFCTREMYNPEWLVGGSRPNEQMNDQELAAFRTRYPAKDHPAPEWPKVFWTQLQLLGAEPPPTNERQKDWAYCNNGVVGPLPASVRMYGRYCYRMDNKSFEKLPMRCPGGYETTRSRADSLNLSCAKCPAGTALKGTESSGFLCVSPCPEGSTDEMTGSTNQCYLIARVMEGFISHKLQELSPDEVEALRMQAEVQKQKDADKQKLEGGGGGGGDKKT